MIDPQETSRERVRSLERRTPGVGRVNLNIDRIVVRGMELSNDRVKRLKENVQEELMAKLARAESLPWRGGRTGRTQPRRVTFEAGNGSEADAKLANAIARAVMGCLSPSDRE